MAERLFEILESCSLARQASLWTRAKDVRRKKVTLEIKRDSRFKHPFQVCRSRDACAGDHLAEEVPHLLPPLTRLHCHLLCEQARQAAQVALSCKRQK